MKRRKITLTLILAAIATVASVIFWSCEKEVDTGTPIQNNSSNATQTKLQNQVEVNFKIFKVTLHRSTTDRPRDHKNCGCLECLGFCDFEWFPDINKALSDIDNNTNDRDHSYVLMQTLNRNQVVFHILEKKDYFEEEFGIDTPLIIPKEALDNTVFCNHNVIVEKGLYHFVEKTQQIAFDNIGITSYGYVVVDIKVL